MWIKWSAPIPLMTINENTPPQIYMSTPLFRVPGISPIRSMISYASEPDEEFFNFEREPGKVYFAAKAIHAGLNYNGDWWPKEELKKSYKTFETYGHVFIEHQWVDQNGKLKAYGRVIKARYVESHDGNAWIEVIAYIDAERFPQLANDLKNRKYTKVSMGCKIDRAVCSICGNVATQPQEQCEHVKCCKGYYWNGRLVYEINYGLTFFDLSLVAEPADPHADIIAVYKKRFSQDEIFKLFEQLGKSSDLF